MAWIHHPELAVDAEVPDETAEIWLLCARKAPTVAVSALAKPIGNS